jgi:hypothetical protein
MYCLPITEAGVSGYAAHGAVGAVGAVGVLIAVGETFILAVARLNSANISLSVESTRVESLVNTLW